LTFGETLTLETVIPTTLRPLVNALRPWNPASGTTQTGRALLEFCRPGTKLYRSSLGIREQAPRRPLKGLTADIDSVGRPEHAMPSAEVRRCTAIRMPEPA
jgi:hypothetical protein